MCVSMLKVPIIFYSHYQRHVRLRRTSKCMAHKLNTRPPGPVRLSAESLHTADFLVVNFWPRDSLRDELLCRPANGAAI